MKTGHISIIPFCLVVVDLKEHWSEVDLEERWPEVDVDAKEHEKRVIMVRE